MPEINSRFWMAFGSDTETFVVKLVNASGSFQVQVVDQVNHLRAAVAEVFAETRSLVLIETYLPGREFVVSVCGPVVSRAGELAKSKDPFAFSVLEVVHAPDERISLPPEIGGSAEVWLRSLDSAKEPELADGLATLAQRIFLDFKLESLVRVDVRGDVEGYLHVIEADARPNLGGLGAEKTSRVSAGLHEQGMGYDDLIMSLFANRLDYLFSHRPATVAQMMSLAADSS